MRLSSGFEHRKARIDMLPLIDVVFILLVFFIYAMLSMVLHRGIHVRLPLLSTAAVEQLPYVAVSLTKDNRLLVNRDPVPIEDLSKAVLSLMQTSGTDLQVFIECDEHADAGMAIRVLDQFRASGIDNVLFASREAP